MDEDKIESTELSGNFILIRIPDVAIQGLEPEPLPPPDPTMYVWTFEAKGIIPSDFWGEELIVIVRANNWGEAIKQVRDNVKLPDINKSTDIKASFKLTSCVEENVYWIGRE